MVWGFVKNNFVNNYEVCAEIARSLCERGKIVVENEHVIEHED